MAKCSLSLTVGLRTVLTYSVDRTHLGRISGSSDRLYLSDKIRTSYFVKVSNHEAPTVFYGLPAFCLFSPDVLSSLLSSTHIFCPFVTYLFLPMTPVNVVFPQNCTDFQLIGCVFRRA